MYSPRLNCPSCHTSIALDRFDMAFAGTNDYWVCPECDYTFLDPTVATAAVVEPVVVADIGSATPEVKALCTTSALGAVAAPKQMYDSFSGGTLADKGTNCMGATM